MVFKFKDKFWQERYLHWVTLLVSQKEVRMFFYNVVEGKACKSFSNHWIFCKEVKNPGAESEKSAEIELEVES